MKLYHATTPRKLARYIASGRIIQPVRGFTTPEAAKHWAVRHGRSIILEFDALRPWKLPDHHNRHGTAWWNEGDVVEWREITARGLINV